MPRVDAIWASALYQKNLNLLVELERDRVYCRHGLEHLLDVARIMWIRCLDEGLELDRELVYAAALLHDIGKAEQYVRGIPMMLPGNGSHGRCSRNCRARRAFPRTRSTRFARRSRGTAVRGRGRVRSSACSSRPTRHRAHVLPARPRMPATGPAAKRT